MQRALVCAPIPSLRPHPLAAPVSSMGRKQQNADLGCWCTVFFATSTEKLYNAKIKRAGSGHELGEVGKGLRLAAAGMSCPAEPVKGGSIQGQPPRGGAVALSGSEPGRQPKTGRPKHSRLPCTYHLGRASARCYQNLALARRGPCTLPSTLRVQVVRWQPTLR